MSSIGRQCGHREPGGFTFLEIVIVLVIAAVILGMLVPGTAGLTGQRRIRAAAADVAEAAVRSRLVARETGIEQTLEFSDDAIAPRGDAPQARERTVHVPEGMKVFFARDGKSWERARGFVWRFSPSGFADPVSLRIESGRRWIEMDFDLLTARVTEERYAF